MYHEYEAFRVRLLLQVLQIQQVELVQVSGPAFQLELAAQL
jgi:hypothetical protein